MLKHHLLKKPRETLYKYQSLIFSHSGYGKQIKMVDSVLQNTFSSPNSITPYNNNANAGWTKINPGTELHYASSYYGASSQANYPFRYGTFSYDVGFSTGSLFNVSSARSSRLFWSPDGKGIVTWGDIYSTISKFDTATGVPTVVQSALSAYGYGGFNNNSNTVAVLHNTSPISLNVYPWSYASGTGTKYANPTTMPTIYGIPLWLSDNSFVILGNRAYGWSNGFTGTSFDSSSLNFRPAQLISDSLILGVSTTTYAVMLISFDKTTGFSTPVTLSGSADNIFQPMPVYDPVYKKVYYSVYSSATASTTFYSCSLDNGVFGTPITLGSISGGAELTEIFTHKSLG